MKNPVAVDILGEPWLAETIPLAEDFEGAVVSTLVSRRTDQDASPPAQGAMLHVHGFSDYFFHTEYADWWGARGHAPYGIDLRKYGRSIRPHQTPTYVADLSDYFEEIDAAWERITVRDGHRHVVLSGHSTGGLVVALWASTRQPDELAGLVLNSPWFDLQGPAWLRTQPAGLLLDQLGRRRPLQAIPRDVTGFYPRSLHRDLDGEWDFDLAWKPVDSYPVRLGWLRAIRRGHARLHAGLGVASPTIVFSAATSGRPTVMDESAFSSDIVLDVHQIRRWASSVGRHVTSVAVPGALHDVVLSRPEPRAFVYDTLQRWYDAYLRTPAVTR